RIDLRMSRDLELLGRANSAVPIDTLSRAPEPAVAEPQFAGPARAAGRQTWDYRGSCRQPCPARLTFQSAGPGEMPLSSFRPTFSVRSRATRRLKVKSSRRAIRCRSQCARESRGSFGGPPHAIRPRALPDAATRRCQFAIGYVEHRLESPSAP